MTSSVRNPGRIALLAGVAMILTTALFYVATLQRELESTAQQIDEHKNTLTRLQAHIAENNRYVNAKPAVGASFARDSFLKAVDDTAATAELQLKLRQVLESANLTFVSSRVLPKKSVDNVVFLGVRLDGTGNLQSLQSGLYTLETSQPQLIIDSLAIAVVPQQSGYELQGERSLRWQADIYAALWGEVE